MILSVYSSESVFLLTIIVSFIGIGVFGSVALVSCCGEREFQTEMPRVRVVPTRHL